MKTYTKPFWNMIEIFEIRREIYEEVSAIEKRLEVLEKKK